MITGIHHVSMKCGTGKEFDQARSFYLDLLGFSVVREWPDGIMIDSGDGLIEIFSNGAGILTKGAIRHVAFSTDDVDGIVEKVRAAGYEVFIEPNDLVIRSEPEFRARMAFCRGPLGEEIEFFREQEPESITGNEMKTDAAVQYRIATGDDIDLLMQSRMDTLRAVNRLADDYRFSAELISASRKFFLEGDQETVLALKSGRIAGCATMCYYSFMPTFSHPAGQRAHLMNVYTAAPWRRTGIAYRMVSILISQARSRGVTEISLDATDSGRPLYRKLGFEDSRECMTLVIR